MAERSWTELGRKNNNIEAKVPLSILELSLSFN